MGIHAFVISIAVFMSLGVLSRAIDLMSPTTAVRKVHRVSFVLGLLFRAFLFGWAVFILVSP